MKRSDINRALAMAKQILREHHVALPPFAYWTPEQWHHAGPKYNRIKDNVMGWHVTDFGIGDFDHWGAVLFTLRNVNHKHAELGTPYAEKVIILKPGQRLPLHFHWSKTEDIVNRGGGTLVLQLYRSSMDESVDEASPVTAFCDAHPCTVRAGEIFTLPPGESITITPKLYHSFWASPEGGILICGEISTVSADQTDNRFAETFRTFPVVEEDEPPLHLLCNEYPS